MRTNFQSPDEYLSYLQEIYAMPYAAGTIQDQEFYQLTMEEFRKAKLELPSGVFGGIQKAIDEAYRIVVQAIPTAQRVMIKQCIAAGVLEHGQANAFIARSPNGKFAILFSSGLALFLHKYTKLVSALVNPSSVIYCNRTTIQNITREEIESYIDEMITYFSRHSVPRGPMIKLAPQESARSSSILMLAETFILCHELGHFLNGDLDDKKRYSALPSGVPGSKYEENIDHETEYKADAVGYGLYLDAIAAMGMDLTPQASLAPIMMMFDLFYRLGGGESSSHPHPHDRIIRIVRDYFDPEMASRTSEALRDPRLLPEVFPISES